VPLILLLLALFVASPALAERPLGWNLETVTNFSTSHHFCDLMKETGWDWNAGSGASGLTEDANKWPTAITGGSSVYYYVTTRIDQNHNDIVVPGEISHYPTGEYTLQCDGTVKVGIFRNGPDLTYQCAGTDTFTFDVAATTGEGLEIRVYGGTITNSGDPHLFKIYPSGDNPAACDPTVETFNPVYRKSLRGSHGGRFMDMAGPAYRQDTIDYIDGRNWADRMPLATRTYTNSETEHNGVPPEIPIMLANELLTLDGVAWRPWIVFPVSVNDNYVDGYGDYIAANLLAGVPLFYAEWCNECWNTGGSYIYQWRFVRALATTHDGTATSGTTTTIVQTGAGWGVNAHAGVAVCADNVDNGSSTSCSVVVSNTSDTITLSPALSFDVDASDPFRTYPGTGSEADWVKRYQGQRSAEVYELLRISMGGLTRLKRVIGAQNKDFGSPSEATTYLDYDPPGALGANRLYTDYMAYAPYGQLGDVDAALHTKLSLNALCLGYDGVANNQCGTDSAECTPGGCDCPGANTPYTCCATSSCKGIRNWVPETYCAALARDVLSQIAQFTVNVTATESRSNLEGAVIRAILYEGGVNHDDRLGGSQANGTGEWDTTLVATAQTAHSDNCLENVLFDYLQGIYAANHGYPIFLFQHIGKWSKFRQFGHSEYLMDHDGEMNFCSSPSHRAAWHWSQLP
jgi:hypothetical protein